MHALDDVRPDLVVRTLDGLADRVRSAVKRPSPEALVAHLHRVLFDEEQFAGNVESYYHPLNSLLPAALTTRRGLPITLSLVYKLVCDRIGLRAEGVGAQSHFMIRMFDGHGWILVDPFFRGQLLTLPEAAQRVRDLSGLSVDATAENFPRVTHREWLLRMTRNLQVVFGAARNEVDFRAMEEFQAELTRQDSDPA